MSASNYPPGLSDSTVGAPWNESDVPYEEFEVTCSQSLSKTVKVTTNNYIPGASGVDYETDDEGHPYATPWHDDPDTTDTDWAEEYHDNDYHTPMQLLELFKQCLEENMKNGVVFKTPGVTKQLISECDGWIEDETDYCED